MNVRTIVGGAVSVLLLLAAVQEAVAELGGAVRIQPTEAGLEVALHFRTDGQVPAHLLAAIDGDAIRDHEVDELGDSRLLRAGRVIGGDDHLGQALDEPELGR